MAASAACKGILHKTTTGPEVIHVLPLKRAVLRPPRIAGIVLRVCKLQLRCMTAGPYIYMPGTQHPQFQSTYQNPAVDSQRWLAASIKRLKVSFKCV